MEVNEVIEEQANDETIEEVEEITEEPEETDNLDVDFTDDTTLSDDETIENFLGTFKTKEEADKGFKEAQAKITEQGNRIKELENQLNINENSIPNVNKEIEGAKQKINALYNSRLQGLGYKYGSYIPDEVQINQIDDIVENLPPQQAAQFTAELINIQNECNANLKAEIEDIHNNANAKFEEIKERDKERFKDNEIAFNAWYNPPETIDDVAQLIENVRKQAVEDYIKEQAVKQEDERHKSKLDISVNGKAKYKDNHIFTREEIGKMSDSEFAKYEEKISQQVAMGLIE